MCKIVVKKNQTRENFSPDKIVKVLIAAGLEEPMSKNIADKIAVWIASLAEKEISTQLIKDKVITELKTVNPYVAGLFQWYQRSKDTPSNVSQTTNA